VASSCSLWPKATTYEKIDVIFLKGSRRSLPSLMATGFYKVSVLVTPILHLILPLAPSSWLSSVWIISPGWCALKVACNDIYSFFRKNYRKCKQCYSLISGKKRTTFATLATAVDHVCACACMSFYVFAYT